MATSLRIHFTCPSDIQFSHVHHTVAYNYEGIITKYRNIVKI